jgi:hypothetical protein
MGPERHWRATRSACVMLESRMDATTHCDMLLSCCAWRAAIAAAGVIAPLALDAPSLPAPLVRLPATALAPPVLALVAVSGTGAAAGAGTGGCGDAGLVLRGAAFPGASPALSGVGLAGWGCCGCGCGCGCGCC